MKLIRVKCKDADDYDSRLLKTIAGQFYLAVKSAIEQNPKTGWENAKTILANSASVQLRNLRDIKNPDDVSIASRYASLKNILNQFSQGSIKDVTSGIKMSISLSKLM